MNDWVVVASEAEPPHHQVVNKRRRSGVRRILITAAAALLPAVWLASAPLSAVRADGAAKAKDAAGGETCGNYGTSVQFVKTPSEAARQALKEEKLVFVLHVSGIFEDPTLT
jgi:hypothetical protein